FFDERIAFYLREVRGHAYDVVKAVMVSGSDDLRDAVARAEAVSAVRGGEDFLAVSAAFKRMKNILQQSADKGIDYPSSVRNDLLTEPSEAALADRSAGVVARVEELRARADYR